MRKERTNFFEGLLNEKAIWQQTSFLLTPFVVTEIAMRRNTVYDRRAHGAFGALHFQVCLA